MDSIDRRILDVLRVNARTPLSQIAEQVGLSSAPVARRIDRLERDGVIRGYTAIVDDTSTGELEAFTEIRLAGGIDTHPIEEIARRVPEVIQYFTIAGDPDALIRLRVKSVNDLQRVVNAIRSSGFVTGTKTLIVLDGWDRMAQGG